MRVKEGATGSTVLDLQSAALNEGHLTIGLAPQGGADPTDGRIAIVGSGDANAFGECGTVPAFFERFGSRGVAVLERVLAELRAAGALAILDVKRGDIGSTADGYADAYLDPASPLAADAITVSPFLGFASVQPFVDAARTHDKGLFVLALACWPRLRAGSGAVLPPGLALSPFWQ